MSDKSFKCRVCEAPDLIIVKKSDMAEGQITSSCFSITDHNYGTTNAIYRCLSCGFLQCPEVNNVLPFYQKLVDSEYEETRSERALQMRSILKKIISKGPQDGRDINILDVGAGSGIFVEEAIKMKYHAEGIEPSRWLYDIAQGRKLPVYNSILPCENIKNKRYDVVTIIDVIEHVNDPYNLLIEAGKCLGKEGIIVITTPDVNSPVAKILGWKWWHFRVAHIGYFSVETLVRLIGRAGLEVISITRPGWCFSLAYLNERVKVYLPFFLHIPSFRFMSKIKINFNLFDSVLMIVRPKNH